jgi:hypothetical protein
MLRVQLDFCDQSVKDAIIEMEPSRLPRVGDEILWYATTTDEDGTEWETDRGYAVSSVTWLMGPDFDAERGPDVTLMLEPDTGR